MERLIDLIDRLLDSTQLGINRARRLIATRRHARAVKAHKRAIDELGESMHGRVKTCRRRPAVYDLRRIH